MCDFHVLIPIRQLGWSYDGPSIYGRYLSASAPGYATALDKCGGHSHDAYGYQ